MGASPHSGDDLPGPWARLASRLALPALVFAAGAVWCGVPVLHEYRTFQCQWHDHGVLFNALSGLWSHGSLYYYDADRTVIQPFWYLLAVAVRPLDTLGFYLALHCLALALGASAVCCLGREVTGSASAGALVAFAFLLSPYTTAANLYAHYEAFMVPAAAFLAYFALRRRAAGAIASLCLLLIIRQDMWLYALGVVGMVCLRTERRLAWTLVGITLAYTVGAGLLSARLEPFQERVFLSHFTQGRTRGEIVSYFVTHPVETLAKVATGHGQDFFTRLLFLPLLAPVEALLALPSIYLIVNSTSPERNSLAFFYALPPLTLYFLATAFALANLGRLAGPVRAPRAMVLAAGLLAVVNGLSQLALPPGLNYSPSLSSVLGVRYDDHHRVGWTLLESDLAGRADSILTGYTLGPYVVERAREVRLLSRDGDALVDGRIRPQYVFYDLKTLDPLIVRGTMRRVRNFLLDSPDYELAREWNGYCLYRRRPGV
jgi:uncharacterized membrane protein